jgi:hypothetical protein
MSAPYSSSSSGISSDDDQQLLPNVITDMLQEKYLLGRITRAPSSSTDDRRIERLRAEFLNASRTTIVLDSGPL